MRDWKGPSEGEKPGAYVVFLGDTGLADSFENDAGIAVQSILLGARARGLGGCIIASVKRDELRAALHIPGRYRILFVLALGELAGEVVLESLPEDGEITYWRDDRGVHHVPKRPLNDLILE